MYLENYELTGHEGGTVWNAATFVLLHVGAEAASTVETELCVAEKLCFLPSIGNGGENRIL